MMFKRRYEFALVRHSWIWPLWMPYRSTFRLLSKQEVIGERSFNGKELFPLKPWPQEYQRMFWAKPIDDKTTFKLMLFCFRNGCAPQLITHLVLLWTLGLRQVASPKRTAQRKIEFTLTRQDIKNKVELNDIGSSFHEGLYKEQVMFQNYIKSTVCLFWLVATTFKPNYIKERVIMLHVST